MCAAFLRTLSRLNAAAERSREENLLNAHAARTAPELSESEAKLQCVVEGIEKDKLLVRFLDLDPGNGEKECNLVIDVSSRSYKGTCGWSG